MFEDCAKPGGVHLSLLPFAIVGFCFYSVGYPMALYLILRNNRERIMEDQLLRAEDRGATRLENPHCYDTRKMYHKCVCMRHACVLDEMLSAVPCSALSRITVIVN